MTEALASKSGISASPGVSILVPQMVAMMLTKQYGDQLKTKAAIAMAIMRTSLIWCFRLVFRIETFSDKGCCVRIKLQGIKKVSIRSNQVCAVTNKDTGYCES